MLGFGDYLCIEGPVFTVEDLFLRWPSLDRDIFICNLNDNEISYFKFPMPYIVLRSARNIYGKICFCCVRYWMKEFSRIKFRNYSSKNIVFKYYDILSFEKENPHILNQPPIDLDFDRAIELGRHITSHKQEIVFTVEGEELAALKGENTALKAEVAALKAELEQVRQEQTQESIPYTLWLEVCAMRGEGKTDKEIAATLYDKGQGLSKSQLGALLYTGNETRPASTTLQDWGTRLFR